METNLSKLIRQSLKRQGLSRADFVKKMGYQNLSKGHQRLTGWLAGVASPTGDQPQRIADATGLKLEKVAQVILEDLNICRTVRLERRALDRNFYLVIRMMAAVYPRQALPRGIDEATALTLARARASTYKRRCCLNTPDGTNYWIDGDGDVYRVDRDPPPSMRIGKKLFNLNIS